MPVNYKKVFDAIETLHQQAAIATKDDPDDFNWGLLYELDHCAQRALWHLSRGEQGELNHLPLTVGVPRCVEP
jgi:hypothetical protein